MTEIGTSLDQIQESKSVVFNSASLELSNISLSLQGDGDSKFTPASVDFDEKHERCTLELPQTIPAGARLRLTIAFEGELTDDLMGYYKSSGGDDDEDVYALTQFEVRTKAHRSMT